MRSKLHIAPALLLAALSAGYIPALGSAGFKLAQTGLSLKAVASPKQFFDVCGQKAVYIEDSGCSEVWIYPFKAVSDFKISYVNKGASSSDAVFKEYEATPQASVCTYSIGEQTARKVIFAPVEERGIVIVNDLPASSNAEIVTRFKSDLVLMWPASSTGTIPAVKDAETGALLSQSSDGKRFVLVGGSDVSAVKTDSDTLEIRQSPKTARDDCSREAVLVIAGGESLSAARETYNKLLRHTQSLYADNCRYYKKLLGESLCVTTPDPDLNDAFRWAKVGLDKCFVESGVGAGFIAGFNESFGGSRPGYAWYFGRDSSWTGFSANFIGESKKAARNLELMTKYQVSGGTNDGKIYHELSTAHDLCADKGYSYVAGDSTPLYVIDMYDYLRWTGDLEFVRKHWPNIKAAMAWCYRMDVDSDGLIDNPPAGHEWYDHGEKNMIDLVAIWQRALESAAAMGRILNAPESDKWAADARKVNHILVNDFWNDKLKYFSDRRLPDGTYTDITTANPALPLLWGQISGTSKAERRANLSIAKLASPDMSTGWGIRSNSKADSIYNHSGYHEGRVWPLLTGWATLAAFKTGNSAQGLEWLKENASLYKDKCLGYMCEIVDGDERIDDGSPHQAWSEALVIQSAAEGLMGISADAMSKKVVFAPNIPKDWASVSVKNLKVGNDRFNFQLERSHGKLTVTVEHFGHTEYTVDVCPAFGKDTHLISAEIDGVSVDSPQKMESLNDIHFPVRAKFSERERHTVTYRF